MAEFKWFKHRLTGLVGYYPADFADSFSDLFEEVPSEDASCVDCAVKDESEPEAVVEFQDAPDPVRSVSEKNKDK